MERKEAIEVIKKNWPDSSFTMLREALETLIPELKENEDEKIRKVLVELVKCNERCGYFMINNTTTSSMLAWLEKQGQTFTKKDVDDAYLKGVCDAKQELEKQGEQRLDWSEEDIKSLNRISTILVDASEVKNWWKEYRLIEREEMIRLTDFLKSLIDRVHPQPIKWSEEDEKVTKWVIDYIGNCPNESFYFYGGVGKEAVLSWLNKLKDILQLQPKQEWKPSEEQIKVCKEVYADILSAKGFDLGTINSELNRLEEELKKLREE